MQVRNGEDRNPAAPDVKPELRMQCEFAASRGSWLPAVINGSCFGERAFLETADPWDADSFIPAFLTMQE